MEEEWLWLVLRGGCVGVCDKHCPDNHSPEATVVATARGKHL